MSLLTIKLISALAIIAVGLMGGMIPIVARRFEDSRRFFSLGNAFAGGVIPNPLDIRFQKVSGLTGTVNTTSHREGGQNLYEQKLPNGISYGNLVLERGMVVGSLLNIELNVALTTYTFIPSNVLVMLFNSDKVPVSGWLFLNAYPVKWSTSDLDANQKGTPMIDTIEVAYQRMQILRV